MPCVALKGEERHTLCGLNEPGYGKVKLPQPMELVRLIERLANILLARRAGSMRPWPSGLGTCQQPCNSGLDL